MTRLLYLVSHPIQYQAPLLRRIAADTDIRLRVIFGTMTSAVLHREPEFGLNVAWDVPLLEGYDSAALADLDLEHEIVCADAVWVHGWRYRWQRRAAAVAARRHVPVLMRGENWTGAMPDPPGPAGWLKQMWRRRQLARCQVFLAIGRKNHEFYAAHGIADSAIFSMPYAVDNEFFAARSGAAARIRENLRQQFGIAPGRRVLLFVGKLTQRKRPDLLLAAWKAAQWSGEPPVLMFVGDGELRAALERDGTGAVFAGFQNQSRLPAFYDLADLLVVPSLREPWGLVVNEAMACGTAVVASDQVGAAYDLIDPGCGAVFRADDQGDLAAKLAAALPRSGELGAAARRRIAGWNLEADLQGLKQALAAVVR